MDIDEQRRHVLTRFYKQKTRTLTVESDHNIMVLYFNFKWCQKIKVDRKEIFNLRNYESQQIFKENTSKNPALLHALQNHDVSKGGAKWMKQLKHEISKSFKKIRLSTGKGKKLDTNLSVLFSLRESLIIKISNSSLKKDEISNLNVKLKQTDEKNS